jgi:hypothetical protein
MLNDSEQELLRQCEPAALAALDEDELIELHTRVRRARTKYSKLYRRNARAQVQRGGKRSGASAGSARTRMKAEGFENALAAVSAALAKEAKRSAAALKAERLEAARSTPGRNAPARSNTPKADGTPKQASTRTTKRTPASEKRRASTKASGARRQAARDGR